MQGLRGSALVGFSMLLVTAGCNQKPQPEPEPKPDRPVALTGNDISKIVLKAHGIDTGTPMVDHVGRPKTSTSAGTVVKWHYDQQFYVMFDPTQNPCEPQNPAPNSGIYNAVLVQPHPIPNPPPPPRYVAECRLTDQPVGTGPFPYELHLGTGLLPAATKPGKKRKIHDPYISHCEGCYLEEDPGAQ
jgi:hypothetical protein